MTIIAILWGLVVVGYIVFAIAGTYFGRWGWNGHNHYYKDDNDSVGEERD